MTAAGASMPCALVLLLFAPSAGSMLQAQAVAIGEIHTTALGHAAMPRMLPRYVRMADAPSQVDMVSTVDRTRRLPCLYCCLLLSQKPGKQEVKPTKAQEERGPTNPWIHPEYEPRQGSLDAAMLRAAFRSLSIKAGSTDGAMDSLEEMLYK